MTESICRKDGLIIVVVTISHEDSEMVSRRTLFQEDLCMCARQEGLIDGVKEAAAQCVNECLSQKNADWFTVKSGLKNPLQRYIYDHSKRNPMILRCMKKYNKSCDCCHSFAYQISVSALSNMPFT